MDYELKFTVTTNDEDACKVIINAMMNLWRAISSGAGQYITVYPKLTVNGEEVTP